MTDFDVLVLGAGAPGEHCAAAVAAGGLRVALVERDLVGGECSYWGCIPSKTLLRPGEALAAARDAPGAREAATGAYTRAYDSRPGFLTLVSDGVRLTGGFALGPEAGEWLQQVTAAVRARTPLSVLLDVIQPFPTFSEAVFQALRELDRQVAESRPVGAAASTGR